MSWPETHIDLKEMIKNSSDNPSKKENEYTPADTTKNEQQNKQEEKDKKTTPESVTVENFLNDIKNDFDTIKKLWSTFQKWTTTDRFLNIPRSYTQGNNPELEKLLKQIENQKNIPFPLSPTIFVQEFYEFNEKRRDDAVSGLKNLHINISAFTIPAGQDVTTYIIKELKDPNSAFAKNQIKQFSIDGYREYADLLAKNPDITSWWQEKVNLSIKASELKALLEPANKSKILAKISDPTIRAYNTRSTSFDSIITLLWNEITNNPRLAINQDFTTMITTLTSGDIKTFQALVYGKNTNNISKYGVNWNDGKLGKETLAATSRYINSLLTADIANQKISRISSRDIVIETDPADWSKEAKGENETTDAMILNAWPIGKTITLAYDNAPDVVGKITSIDSKILVIVPDNEPTTTITSNIKEITADKIVIYREGDKTYTITNSIPFDDQPLNENTTKPSNPKNINYSKLTQAPMA